MAEALPDATHFAKLAEEGTSVKRLFAVIRSRGAAWNDSLPLEEQEDWRPHADFMNALHAEGFVVIGGRQRIVSLRIGLRLRRNRLRKRLRDVALHRLAQLRINLVCNRHHRQ